LTIEDTSTRFWFFSRATVAVSEVFDFREVRLINPKVGLITVWLILDVQKPLALLQLFLAFACSSVERLGFDTTIRCVDVTQVGQPFEQWEDEGRVENTDQTNAEGSTIVTNRTCQAATGERLNRKK
jgi:hypothetical protein